MLKTNFLASSSIIGISASETATDRVLSRRRTPPTQGASRNHMLHAGIMRSSHKTRTGDARPELGRHLDPRNASDLPRSFMMTCDGDKGRDCFRKAPRNVWSVCLFSCTRRPRAVRLLALLFLLCLSLMRPAEMSLFFRQLIGLQGRNSTGVVRR